MRIAICEDNAVFAKELAAGIQAFFENKNIVPVIDCYFDEKLVQKISEDAGVYDIVFMDIDLGGQKDGVELCHKLRIYAPLVPIIFITSLENRAIDGYDVDAFGFVVKKAYEEKLPLVLEKLWKQMYETKTLTVTEKSEMHVLPVKDILWIESEGRNSLVHTIHETFMDIRSIQNLAPALSETDFIECFKSVFVNVEKIKSVNADTLILLNDHKLPVSRRSRKGVMLAVMKKVREQ